MYQGNRRYNYGYKTQGGGLMDYINGYDEKDPLSIERYAQQLIGKTFEDVCEADDRGGNSIIRESFAYNVSHEDKKFKGGLGNLIEERFFHYQANDDSRPDFPEAGVELKVTPYKIVSSDKKVAKERLIITMINYHDVVLEDFYNSHLWLKSKKILLIYYLWTKEIVNRLKYRIDYARLFTPPENDLRIIRHDFKVIVDKIKAGKAHELSESDTMYLGAATKSSKGSVTRTQPFSDIPAKPRAFAFKNSYMTYVLNNYIIPGRPEYESILGKDTTDSFEDYVKNKIHKYSGRYVDDLCHEFEIDIKRKPKNLGAMIAFRILGVNSNGAEEFEKAGIKVKTIRIGSNGKIKEGMSFPTFRFKELVQEDWESSSFREYLSETRFFFIVYQFDSRENLYLKGCQFWNIPYSDLEGNVKKVWLETKEVLKSGLKVTRVGKRNVNNFPKASENDVSHVRPHAQNMNDTDELPDGRQYPKQCFWLNNSYILSQLEERLKS